MENMGLGDILRRQHYEEKLAKIRAYQEKQKVKPKVKRPMTEKRKRTEAWRRDRKASMLAQECVDGMFWCPLGEHWAVRSEAALCEKRCRGMRGDGNTVENTFLGCYQGNGAQGSVHLDEYLKLPLEVRRKNCGVT